MIRGSTKEHLQPWTITQLQAAHNNDLALCQTAFERINVAALHRIELKRAAALFGASRRLMPHEVAILKANGITVD